MVVLVAAPLLPVLYQSFLDGALYDDRARLTLGNFVRLTQTDGFGLVLWNTFVLAALTTIVAQVFGTIAAILFGRTDIPGARVLGELFLWPIYLSALVLSFGWYSVYGPAGYFTLFWQTILGDAPWNLYPLGGMAMIAGVSQAPLAYLYCLSSAGMTDPTLEKVARVSGAGTFRTLWRVTPPLMMPAIAYSAVLNFTIGLELLSVPLIFGEPAGINVLTTFLYNISASSPRPDHGLAATAAALMLVVIVFLVWLQSQLLGNTRRFVTLGGKATRPPLPSGRAALADFRDQPCLCGADRRDPANLRAATALLAERVFPNLASSTIAAVLGGQIAARPGGLPVALPHPTRFDPGTPPSAEWAARWFAAMGRWGHLPESATESDPAPWRPDLWQRAAALPTTETTAPREPTA